MMKGIIDYLIGPTIGAEIVRSNYLMKIVPMINIDGVINGNTRCSLYGVDLNRCWIDPQKDTHPVLFALKWLIKNTQNERDIMLFVDLHGHSRKKNIFMYGNSYKNDTKLKERVFPYLLEKQAESFSYSDCSFVVQRAKEGTGRVVGWKELQIQNSFTIEASFCGSDFGKYADLHFNTSMLTEIGPHLCEAIIEYEKLIADQVQYKQVISEIEDIISNNQNQKEEGGSKNLEEVQQQQMGGLLLDGGGLGTI